MATVILGLVAQKFAPKLSDRILLAMDDYAALLKAVGRTEGEIHAAPDEL